MKKAGAPMTSSKKQRCTGKTASGDRCKRNARSGTKYCKTHTPKIAEVKRTGRPSKYKVVRCVKAALLSSSEGATDASIATGCGVSVETVRDWYDTASPRYKPGFSRAVKEARARCGSIRENSLWKRSTWQVIEDESETIERVLPPTGKAARERIEQYIDSEGLVTKHVITKSKRTIPPDVAALIFSLCNTDKMNWRHVSNIERPADPTATDGIDGFVAAIAPDADGVADMFTIEPEPEIESEQAE